MQYLGTNQKTIYRVCMWKRKNTDVRNKRLFNGMVLHVYRLEDSILLRCQLFVTWSIGSVKSLSKAQEAILLISKNWF